MFDKFFSSLRERSQITAFSMAKREGKDTLLNTLGLVAQLGCIGLQLILVPSLFDNSVYGALQGVLATGYLLATLTLAGLQSVALISLSRGRPSSKKVYLLAQHKILVRIMIITVASMVVALVSPWTGMAIAASVPISVLLFIDSLLISNRRFIKLLFRRVLPDLSLVIFFLAAFYLKISADEITAWLPSVVCAVFILPAIAFTLLELFPMGVAITSPRTGLNLQRPALPFLGWTLLQALMQRGSVVLVASIDLGVVVYLRYCQYVAQIGQYLSNGLLLVRLRNLLGDGKHLGLQANKVGLLTAPGWLVIFFWSIAINSIFWVSISFAASYTATMVIEPDVILIILSVALTCVSVAYQWSSAGTNWQGQLQTYLIGQVVTISTFSGGLLILRHTLVFLGSEHDLANIGVVTVVALTLGRAAGTAYYQLRRKGERG